MPHSGQKCFFSAGPDGTRAAVPFSCLRKRVKKGEDEVTNSVAEPLVFAIPVNMHTEHISQLSQDVKKPK